MVSVKMEINNQELPSDHQSMIEFSDVAIALASPRHHSKPSDLNLPTIEPGYVRLALEELNCFETVQKQFAHWGILFQNAIAISPSNPAFGVSADVKVLMGAPKSGLIEITFDRPVKLVKALVTSTRRSVLSAYDHAGEIINQTEMPGANLIGCDSEIAPNFPLSVQGSPISKVSFYAFDGQIILHSLLVEF